MATELQIWKTYIMRFLYFQIEAHTSSKSRSWTQFIYFQAVQHLVSQILAQSFQCVTCTIAKQFDILLYETIRYCVRIRLVTDSLSGLYNQAMKGFKLVTYIAMYVRRLEKTGTSGNGEAI